MCIKEVKWTLEMAPPIERACILAMAQLFRISLFEAPDFPRDLIDQPFSYSRADLFSAYEALENSRNMNTLQLERTKRSMKTLGLEFPQFSEEHAKSTVKGVEIWMCTLGAGIAPDRRDDVRTIWFLLAGSFGEIVNAIFRLRQVEAATNQMTGGGGDGKYEMFGLPDDVWIKESHFIPAAFSRTLT